MLLRVSLWPLNIKSLRNLVFRSFGGWNFILVLVAASISMQGPRSELHRNVEGSLDSRFFPLGAGNMVGYASLLASGEFIPPRLRFRILLQNDEEFIAYVDSVWLGIGFDDD